VLASTRLTDGVVELRPPHERDVDEVFAAVRESIAELSPWMDWCHPEFAVADTAQWVRDGGRRWQQDVQYPFVIRTTADGRVVGSCGLNGLDRQNRWANLGYWLRTGATGRGYATRAARLVAGFALDVVGLDRVEILVAVGNARSLAVARRVGACEEGRLRRRLRVRADSYDAVVFSLVRGDALDAAPPA
jgi:RimJ/RimL family protein N-acetyltransferase